MEPLIDFEIGQQVWCIFKQKVEQVIVKRVSVSKYENEQGNICRNVSLELVYNDGAVRIANDIACFSSEHELMRYLFPKVNVDLDAALQDATVSQFIEFCKEHPNVTSYSYLRRALALFTTEEKK